MLVYAVVPHHHHDSKSQICILSSHCQNNDFDDTHQHDNQTKSNNCLLSQAIVLPLNSNKEDDNIACNYESDIFTNTTCDFINEYLTHNPIDIFLSHTYFTFSSYIHSSLGLRAPPSV
jgi:hypothetical protein